MIKEERISLMKKEFRQKCLYASNEQTGTIPLTSPTMGGGGGGGGGKREREKKKRMYFW